MFSFVIYELKVAVIMTVFYLFYRVMLSRETLHRLNRAVLMATVLVSFVLTFCVITIHRTVEVSDTLETINNQPITDTFLWPSVNADSDDWYTRNPDTIYNKVMKYEYYDGDVILFHDIYSSTAEAVEKIVPALINRGYQLVTVKDMLQYAKIDINDLKFYYNLNPSPYYE